MRERNIKRERLRSGKSAALRLHADVQTLKDSYL